MASRVPYCVVVWLWYPSIIFILDGQLSEMNENALCSSSIETYAVTSSVKVSMTACFMFNITNCGHDGGLWGCAFDGFVINVVLVQFRCFVLCLCCIENFI